MSNTTFSPQHVSKEIRKNSFLKRFRQQVKFEIVCAWNFFTWEKWTSLISCFGNKVYKNYVGVRYATHSQHSEPHEWIFSVLQVGVAKELLENEKRRLKPTETLGPMDRNKTECMWQIHWFLELDSHFSDDFIFLSEVTSRQRRSVPWSPTK